ncbi:ATP-binding protein [Nocardia aobensis]|uniref:Oxygen sensor histidine kinase NreB n=1 Tax=Nocardia aobensis TaxID=257277 RepID=A0ABW6PF86_9NOCA
MQGRSGASSHPSLLRSESGELAPYGLARTDSAGIIVWVNAAAAEILGRPASELCGTPLPFSSSAPPSYGDLALFDDDADTVASVTLPGRTVRDLSYRTRELPDGDSVFGFRDVTKEKQRQRRIAAIARKSASMSSLVSVSAMLDALAQEILLSDSVAAVQIMTLDQRSRNLRIMGSAGFRHWPDFFERLRECNERGAPLRLLEALDNAQPVVFSDLWNSVRTNPAWAPLQEYLGELSWESFATVPMVVRTRAVGLLNVFFAPGQLVTARILNFLEVMAEQAAMAVDYITLIKREADVVRREERQRLARDLHDSVVQHAFSIAMQAKSLALLAGRNQSISAQAVESIADEIGALSQTVLSDLRAMVHELRPVSPSESGGLADAVRALATSTAGRTGLKFNIIAGKSLEQLSSSMADDVYRIVTEAIHNVVKHAEAEHVTVRLVVKRSALRGTVTDDGRGLRQSAGDGRGFGLHTMRERAEQWGGTLIVSADEGSGTVVAFVLPLVH